MQSLRALAAFFQMPNFQQQNHKAYKEIRNHGPFKRKKIKLAKSVREEAKTSELIDKDFKMSVLNILKGLKKEGKRISKEIRKMIYKK